MFYRERFLLHTGVSLALACLAFLVSTPMAYGLIDQSQSELSDIGDQDGMDAGIRMVVSLLVVLAVIMGGVFLLKKVTPFRGIASDPKRPVLVLSKLPLGQRKSVCLVKIADEILIIGMTNTNISLLSKMSIDDYYGEGYKDIHENSEAVYRQSFRKILDRIGMWNRRTSNPPSPQGSGQDEDSLPERNAEVSGSHATSRPGCELSTRIFAGQGFTAEHRDRR